ncbi:MAG: polysaccharide biosynthesis/export family protein [Prevotella sp.]|nr:polysaccharide biosynthesis/export family protein [Bacteroidales bacterium]
MRTLTQRIYSFPLILVVLCVLASCGSNKNFVYLQDMQAGQGYPFENKHEAVIHRDDRLSITVSCKQPELALPFNVQSGAIRVSSSGEVTQSSDASIEAKEKGYRVDIDGNISFPILGQLHVEGMTVSALTNHIRTLIIQGNYIKDPIVSIEFLNFKYTVLGAVGNNGTFSVKGDRITLLEAIANAGDLATNARVDNVMVIREVGNERQVYEHDLRNSRIFDSPAFYLQQNDVVYVEPKYRKKDASEKTWQYITGLFSFITAVCSIIWAVK